MVIYDEETAVYHAVTASILTDPGLVTICIFYVFLVNWSLILFDMFKIVFLVEFLSNFITKRINELEEGLVVLSATISQNASFATKLNFYSTTDKIVITEKKTQLNTMYYLNGKPVLLADQYTGGRYTCYQ